MTEWINNTVWVKLGTQPAAVQFKYHYNLRIGLRVAFRTTKYGRWETGIIDGIDPIFIEKM